MLTRRTVLHGAVAMPALIGLAGTARAAKFNLKFASEMVDTHPAIIRTREAADAIRRETQGEVDIRIFPNAQLGSGQEMLTQIRTAPWISTPPQPPACRASYRCSISSLGFSFPGYDQVWAAMDGKLGAFIREEIAKTGAVLALEAMYDNGFRQITTARVRSKARRPQGRRDPRAASRIYTSLFTAFGARRNRSASASSTPRCRPSWSMGRKTRCHRRSLKYYEVQKYVSSAITCGTVSGFWRTNDPGSGYRRTCGRSWRIGSTAPRARCGRT